LAAAPAAPAAPELAVDPELPAAELSDPELSDPELSDPELSVGPDDPDDAVPLLSVVPVPDA
jgi:hypothetical protein